MVIDTYKTLTLTGLSGRKYVFNIYSYAAFNDLESAFRPISALYLFVIMYDNDMCSMIYLGETSDLSTRFYNHHKEYCIKSRNANRICVCAIEGETSRKNAEDDLLSAYKFPCNEKKN